MFAPLVAKPAIKSAQSQRSVVGTPWHGRTALAPDTEDHAAPLSSPEAAPSWDFGKVAVFSSTHAERHQGPPLFPVPRLPGPIQAKLKIGAVDDPLEHEADRVADRVMRMPVPQLSTTAAPPRVSRKCAQCEEEEKLQRKSVGLQHAGSEAPASVRRMLRAPGQPLDTTTREFFEPRFGRDFRQVRVHADAGAAASARDINAHAYTVGQNIAFDMGRFAPGTHEGRRLIAHELTHVVQQGASAAAVQRAPAPDAERAAAVAEAERIAGHTVEQMEVQSDAEDALKLNWHRRKDKNYAWSLGRKDRDRLQKSGKLSAKFQHEITVKMRFFEGEVRAAYLQMIGPALQESAEFEQIIDLLAEPAGTEKTCAVGQMLLVYQGKPGQGRCLPNNDSEFRQDYIDNHIVQAEGLALPGTTWENIDHDRIPKMKLTYRDGRTLVIDVKDITGGASIQPLAKYEKRSDGFIYPIRSSGTTDYVSYGDATNIASLRAGLHDEIEELKLGFQLIEAGAAFAGDIAALGGIASLMGHPGGLFEPVPKKSRAPAAEKPARSKISTGPRQESQHPTGEPSPSRGKPVSNEPVAKKPPAQPGKGVSEPEGSGTVKPSKPAGKHEADEEASAIKVSAKDKKKRSTPKRTKETEGDARDYDQDERADKRKDKDKKSPREQSLKEKEGLVPPGSDQQFQQRVNETVKRELSLSREGRFPDAKDWTLENLKGPDTMPEPDPTLKPGRGYRYYASYRKPDGSGVNISVNYDPIDGHFGIIKESSTQP